MNCPIVAVSPTIHSQTRFTKSYDSKCSWDGMNIIQIKVWSIVPQPMYNGDMAKSSLYNVIFRRTTNRSPYKHAADIMKQYPIISF